MSIEAMYPSRNQSRSQNPLFAREQRRNKLVLMLIMGALGLGLLLIQIIPMKAHADNAASQATETVRAVASIKLETPAAKPVRQIQIYDLRKTTFSN